MPGAIYLLSPDAFTAKVGTIKIKLTNTRQNNKYLLEYIGYMFRPVNRLSSDLQQSKSQELF